MSAKPLDDRRPPMAGTEIVAAAQPRDALELRQRGADLEGVAKRRHARGAKISESETDVRVSKV